MECIPWTEQLGFNQRALVCETGHAARRPQFNMHAAIGRLWLELGVS